MIVSKTFPKRDLGLTVLLAVSVHLDVAGANDEIDGVFWRIRQMNQAEVLGVDHLFVEHR